MSQIFRNGKWIPSDKDPFGLACMEPTMAKQEFKDDCDINLIVKRALNGQVVTHINERVAYYGDVSQIPDYHRALMAVRQAEEAFMTLDAFTRERFGNDPEQMIKFLNDPQNYAEAVKMGLLDPEKVKMREEAQKAKAPSSGAAAAAPAGSGKGPEGAPAQ